MKKLLFFLLGIGLIIAGCTESQNLSISDNKSSIESSSSDCISIDLQPVNPSNPWDYIGISHNEALDHAASIVDVTSASDQALFDAIKDYFYQTGGSPEFIQSLNEQTAPSLLFDEEDMAGGMTFEEYKIKYQYPNSQSRNRILDDLQMIVFETDYQNEQEIIDNMIIYESNFLAEESEYNKSHYLGLFSILRHSIEYWIEARDNECHPWHNVVDQGNLQSRWFNPEALARLAVDLAHHADCLEYGGLGATSLQQAHDNCRPNSIYASARAFEPGLGGG